MENLATTHQSAAASSSAASTSYYCVFINHHGPDVKNNFTSNLHRGLLDHGLRVSFDQEELEEGHNIYSQIVHAIRAPVHIELFSPRYAQSSWCLNEKLQDFEKKSALPATRELPCGGQGCGHCECKWSW